MRERLVAWACLLGWKVVCRVPRRLAELAFRLVADWVWRRRGRSVRQLEANLQKVFVADLDPERLARQRAGGEADEDSSAWTAPDTTSSS